jgi:hypothetical protein
MIARYPLRIEQREFAGFHRDRLTHIENSMRDVCQIDMQIDGSGILNIRWSADRRRQRHGLWPGRALRITCASQRDGQGSEESSRITAGENRKNCLCQRGAPVCRIQRVSFDIPRSAVPSTLNVCSGVSNVRGSQHSKFRTWNSGPQRRCFAMRSHQRRKRWIGVFPVSKERVVLLDGLLPVSTNRAGTSHA